MYSSELLSPFNAGTPIVRINRNALVLEGPSDASRKKSEEVCMYVNCEQWLALCVCVCVCTCMRACVRACVRAYIGACVFVHSCVDVLVHLAVVKLRTFVTHTTTKSVHTIQ